MNASRSSRRLPDGLEPGSLAPFLAPGTDRDVEGRYERLPAAAAVPLDLHEAEREIAFLDVETTGFDPSRDRVIEVAVLVAAGPIVIERFCTLVDPGVPIPLEATQLTGIDDEAVSGAPGIEEAVERVLAVVGDRDIVAHNACFDKAFIEDAARRAGRVVPGRWLDSLQLARVALPRMRSHRLADLARAFGLAAACHRAAEDVEAMFSLWRISLAGLADLPPELLTAIAGLAPGVEWPLRDELRRAAARAPAGASLDLRRLRMECVRGKCPSSLADASGRELRCPDAGEVAAQFAADGIVGRMYPGFERRDEQVRMADAVLAAFGEGRHLAVEAGTGVGKSVAYLVPAAAFAMSNHLGVGVATKTNSLMDQLVHNELPRLAGALEGTLRFVALKGYEHYPCLRKVERMVSASDEPDADSLANLAALLAWVAQSPWGDLDSVNVHWGPMRQRVACSVEDCTRKRCRYFPNLCYLHGVRRRAASAHVVVTNHALLFRDAAAAGGILPPLRYWVVDEAHAAESEARKQLSVTAENRALLALLAALHAEGRGGLIDALRSRARAQAMAHGHEELAARVDRATSRLRADIATATTVAGSFFDFLKDLPFEESDYDSVDLHVTPEVRDRAEWSVAAGAGASLCRRLRDVLGQGRDLLTALEETGEELEEQRADLAGYLSRLAEQTEGLEAVLDGSDGSYVYSAHVSRRREDGRVSVTASMLDVGAALAERFFPEAHSVVFTSATIATGDDFSHLARTVGLDRLPDSAWSSLRLESSYDFDRQMAVFVPSDLPEPGRGHLEPLADLLASLHVAMGGSVLTLFTSRREMEQVHARVSPLLEGTGLRLLVQGRGVSVKRVRDEFIADERVSLFATKSFWEGFDAKGDTLRCVVIARLPFGRVRDPLYGERRLRDARAWDDYYLPEAVLELKQAAGRLVRSSTDEGCVVIADGRLSSGKGYASRFLAALPVSDVEVAPAAELVERVRARFGRTLGKG